MTGERTIARLWRDATAVERSAPAYLHEVDGEWVPVSWDEAAEAVDEIANGLLALGIAKGDSFALVGRTELEWALFDFALALVGAVGAPIYSSSSERDVQYVLDHSRCRRRARRGRRAARQGRRRGAARRLVRGPRRAARGRPCVRGGQPECAAGANRLDRRG